MSDDRAHSYCPVCMATYDDPRFGFCKRDGARLRPISELGSAWIGRTINGRYRVVRFLGRGAMAEVYEAQHLALERRVAIKVMQPLLATDPISVERFKREARVIALIDHPNVVGVEDFGVLEDGTWFMVMELLRGRSVEEALQAGPFEPHLALTVAIQACAALQAAHDKNVVHRDVKPANLFLQEPVDGGEPVVRLLDLGIAKVPGREAESNLTATGLVFGTPVYMSPEQAQGLPVDHRSDIYSLGVVLYRMLIGEVPFSAASFIAVLTKHVTEAPSWPAELAEARGVPPAAERVLRRVLSKNPAHRYQSMRELQTALVDLRAQVSGNAAPTGAVPEAQRSTTTGRHTILAVALREADSDSTRDVVEIAPDVYWVGRREGVLLERNTYLRVYRGRGVQLNVLIDPGPPQDLESVAAKVGFVIGALSKVDVIFLNHQDPDVSMNAATIQAVNPRAHVWCSEDTWRLAHFYGLKPQGYSAVEHFRDLRTTMITGHPVIFVPTPYCHFRGAVMYYDPASRVLFSGDLFGGLSATRDFVADEASWHGVEIFHQLYMPSREALRRAVAAVRRLDPPPLIIAPQHGGIVCSDRIPTLLERTERLEVGVDLLATGIEKAPYVRALGAIVEGLVPVLGAQRVAEELRSFAVDGSFPNLFLFAGEREIADIKIEPRAALRALVDHLRSVLPHARQQWFDSLVRESLERHSLPTALRADSLLTRDDSHAPSKTAVIDP
jgi:eukaryotic-like serine/threonine-protein kinase